MKLAVHVCEIARRASRYPIRKHNGARPTSESFDSPVKRQFASAHIVESYGLTGLRFHDLRHAHATLMLLDGVHPKVVSERLGHSNVGITLDTYSHVLPSLQAQAAASLERLLAAGKDAQLREFVCKCEEAVAIKRPLNEEIRT